MIQLKEAMRLSKVAIKAAHERLQGERLDFIANNKQYICECEIRAYERLDQAIFNAAQSGQSQVQIQYPISKNLWVDELTLKYSRGNQIAYENAIEKYRLEGYSVFVGDLNPGFYVHVEWSL